MPGPYGDGTNYYKIDADNIHIETISSRYLTRADINEQISNLNIQKTEATTQFDNQIAPYTAMLAILNS
jgi:hypothetical protein